jgi:hypothetical protein
MSHKNTSKSLAKAKYEIIEIGSVEITVDVSLLQKSEDMFFNATEIAKQFGKKPNDFLKTGPTKEYIDIIISEYGNDLNRYEDLVRTVQGGKRQGTWLHKEIALEFAGWCSAGFRRGLHKWVENKLSDEHERKQKRLELKTGYLPLTDAIQHAHEDPKFYHYSNEADLINRIVTGMSAKEFKRVHGVENVRDGLTAAESKLMDRLQRQNASLIELGFSYEERKRLLAAQASKAA